MADVLDVAAYILAQRGPMSAMKLQKLVYYSQAWSLVWDDNVLFSETIEAWENGPVVRALYNKHRGQFRVEQIDGGDSAALTSDQEDTVDLVLSFYGDKDAQWLSDLTHMEGPWQKAWNGDPNGDGIKEITLDSIAEYYSSLEPPSEQA
jgi:uncharacterized phage-associated protein